MGLRWLADNIENYDPENVHTSDLTRDIVHICQNIGINQITKNNYREWYHRWVAATLTQGDKWLKNPDDWPNRPGEYSLTLEQVKSYIGLTTNASRLTDFQFKKALAQALLERADYHVRVQEGKA
jgi:hypothetical protein